MSTTTVGVEERLFFLSASDGQLLSMSTSGADRKILVEGQHLPDGIVVDAAAGHIYWTNMGVPDRNDGSIMRCDLDGGHVTTIVPSGGTHTPKQICLDGAAGKLYWTDAGSGALRVGSTAGGGTPSTLDTEAQTAHPTGLAIDAAAGKLYWTDEGSGEIRGTDVEADHAALLSTTRRNASTSAWTSLRVL